MDKKLLMINSKSDKEKKDNQEEFKYHLKKGNIFEIQNFYNDLTEEEIKSPEIKEMAMNGFLNQLKSGFFHDSLKIQDMFFLNKDEILNIKKIKETAIKIFLENINRIENIIEAGEIKEYFLIEEGEYDGEEVDEAVSKVLLYALERDYFEIVIKVLDKFSIGKGKLEEIEVDIVKILENKIKISKIDFDNLDFLYKMKDYFNISEYNWKRIGLTVIEEYLYKNNLKSDADIENFLKIVGSWEVNESNFREIILVLIGESFKIGNFDLALKAKDEFLEDQDKEEFVEKMFEGCLLVAKSYSFTEMELIEYLENLYQKFPEYKEDIKQKMLVFVREQISSGNLKRGVSIKFFLDIENKEILPEVKIRIKKELMNGKGIEALKLIDDFNLDIEDIKKDFEMREAVIKGMERVLASSVPISDAIYIKNSFDLTDKDFENLDYRKVFTSLLSGSRFSKIREILENFPAKEEILNSYQFKSDAIDLIITFLKSKDGGLIRNAKEIKDFSFSKEDMKKQENREVVYNASKEVAKNDLVMAIEIKEMFNLKISYYEKNAVDIFGDLLTNNLCNEIIGLENNIIGPELQKIGITEFKNQGVEQLRERISGLKNKISGKNSEDTVDFNSEFERSFFIKYTKYSDSRWGGNSENELLRTVQKIKELKEKKPELLKEKFNLVKTYRIDKKESSIEKDLYREDFLIKFDSIINEIKISKENVQKEESFRKQIRSLVDKVEEVKKNIKDQLLEKINSDLDGDEIQNKEKAKQALQNRLSLLDSLNLASIKDFQNNFSVLSGFKEVHPLLREIVFTMGFLKHENQLEKNLDMISLDTPDINDISWILNFIEHIVNQETFEDFFTNKKSKKKFEKIINVSSFKDQMVKLQSGGSKNGGVDITYSTHRDLQTEISGQTGDACWASKYNSILETYSNAHSLLMVEDKGKRGEKIVGSSMLMETKSSNGEDLLIIRGLNPKQNFINSVDVKSYFNSVVSYVKEIASKEGKKVAISIDEYSGGHTTNRPLLFSYIKSIEKDLEKVEILNPDDVEFNGYRIENDIYLLD